MSTKKEIIQYFEERLNVHYSRIEKIEESLRLLKQENEKEFAKQSDMDALKRHAEGLANRIALLEFKIDNPQKYQKGMRVGDEIVSGVKIEGHDDIYVPALYFRSVRLVMPSSRPIFLQSDYRWSYELTNTKTGDKTTCSEYTLTQLIEARAKADAEKKTPKKR